MSMFLLQVTPNTPVTIDGAVILVLFALAVAMPKLLEGVQKILSAIADRLNAGTNTQVRQLDVFKLLEEEVKHLREEREADQYRIANAEKKATEAEVKSDGFRKELDSEKEKRIQMQLEMKQMKERMDSVLTEDKLKDEKIVQQQQRIYELEAENALLKTRLQTKELKWPESPSLSPPSDTVQSTKTS